MNTENLEFNISLICEEIDLYIENYDIHYYISKSADDFADFAKFVIWNLDSTTYNKLISCEYDVSV